MQLTKVTVIGKSLPFYGYPWNIRAVKFSAREAKFRAIHFNTTWRTTVSEEALLQRHIDGVFMVHKYKYRSWQRLKCPKRTRPISVQWKTNRFPIDDFIAESEVFRKIARKGKSLSRNFNFTYGKTRYDLN